MNKNVIIIAIVFILFMTSCAGADYEKKSSYLYDSIYETILPLKETGSQFKIYISEVGMTRLVVLNNNIRLSTSKANNLCHLKKLSSLTSISKDCSSVTLYSIDEKLLTDKKKSQLEIYKKNFEFNHLSGLKLKEVDIYKGGVLFEYVDLNGLSTYYYTKELESSRIFQFSVFNVSSKLFDSIPDSTYASELGAVVSYIELYLNNQLSLNEFKDLDLNVKVNSIP